MKRIVTMGVVVTFVSAANAAQAATTPYSSGVQQQIQLSRGLPKGDTTAAQQAATTYPATASQAYRHRNHPACAVYTPDWPYSVEGP
jgi:hypothetical protein